MDRLNQALNSLYARSPFMGNVVFIDVETTGFERNARIIEIGAIGVIHDGMNLSIKTFDSLINPGFDISAKITEITGITNSELRASGKDDAVYHEFIEWLKPIEPKKMIAHNARFDKAKLLYNLERVGIDTRLIPGEFDCTMNLSRKLLSDIKSDTLGSLCDYFNFKNKSAHRALADTESCAYIYCQLQQILK